MSSPIDLASEKLRLEALREYQILDTAPDNDFDSITSLVSKVLDVPIALVSLVDEDRQWFKSAHGLDVKETSRERSYCSQAILADGLFEVKDAREDTRFADSPIVTGDPKTVFYAGAPLVTPDGYKVGTLCAIDTKPRELNENQKALLTELARSIVQLLELRKKNLLLENFVSESINKDLLESILSISPAKQGKLYIQEVVCSAAKILDMQFALVGQLNADGSIINTDTFVVNGEVSENFSYDLKGTPCENVYSGQRVCLYKEEVARAFPEDLLLEQMGIQSYIGAPIYNPIEGEPDAIFVFLDTKKRHDSVFLKSSVEFLANRIGVEYFRTDNTKTNLFLTETLEYLGGPCSIKDRDGHILYANSALSDLVGLEIPEIIGKKTEDIFSPKYADLYNKSDLRVMETLQTVTETTYSEDKAGNVLTYKTHRIPILDNDKEVIAIVMIATDITDIRQKEIKQIHDEKLKELGEKIAVVAHEINNPLAVIMSGIDLLATQVESSEQVQKRIESLKSGTGLIREIVGRLKSISRKEDDEFQDVNLRTNIEDLLEGLTEHYSTFGIDIRFDCLEHKSVRVMGSSGQLQQVFLNLISNAKDALDDSPLKSIHVHLYVDGGFACVEVKDTGTGIPDKVKKNVFDNFFTTKENGKGTGIGLHFSSSVIRAHGGEISIKETGPSGTTFIVSIPLLP